MLYDSEDVPTNIILQGETVDEQWKVVFARNSHWILTRVIRVTSFFLFLLV